MVPDGDARLFRQGGVAFDQLEGGLSGLNPSGQGSALYHAEDADFRQRGPGLDLGRRPRRQVLLIVIVRERAQRQRSNQYAAPSNVEVGHVSDFDR